MAPVQGPASSGPRKSVVQLGFQGSPLANSSFLQGGGPALLFSSDLQLIGEAHPYEGGQSALSSLLIRMFISSKTSSQTDIPE